MCDDLVDIDRWRNSRGPCKNNVFKAGFARQASLKEIASSRG